MAVILYDVGGELRSVLFDATIKETHGNAGTATEHPVETGANISDHFIKSRNRVSLEVQVTNTPITNLGVDGVDGAVAPLDVSSVARQLVAGASVAGDTGGALEAVSTALLPFPVARALRNIPPPTVTPATWEERAKTHSASVLQFSQPFDRVAAVRTILKELQDAGSLLSVITAVDQYDQMVLENMETVRADRDSVDMILDFVEVITVESQIVDVPDPVEPRGKKKTNAGAQPTEPASAENVSAWNQLQEAFTGFRL